MTDDSSHQPRPIHQVMVSSTFTDLEEHRKALIDVLHHNKLHANVMEHDDAGLMDVIDSSLQMVRDSAAYIAVISFKYGQTPECSRRNPNARSITELEFDEALSLGRPTLLFIMGDDHPVKKRDVEADAEKRAKLDAFREQAKRMSPDSSAERVYAVFNSLDEFKAKIGPSVAKLSRALDSQPFPVAAAAAPKRVGRKRIPTPPVFYAQSNYIGSHTFVGREAQLQELDDWAKPADPTNLLLYEAIGGNGKSMLTWEWTTNPRYAPSIREWAGRFWYSFYERGAVMADFCCHALAYMTGRPLGRFRNLPRSDLTRELLARLHEKPWLLVLDGLERVLVAYHRIDAAEVRDEEVNAPTDKVLNRNPCDTIRDEDGDLLRALVAAAPSKILISSRLTPRVLLNPSGQPLPGARRITLPGLRPADAERLLRSCEIEGDSTDIQNYLTQNCDNHPLVIGVLAGLVANYLPSPRDFDAWLADPSPQGGAKLDLSSLDLIQRRNHILRTALDDLPDASRQLLSTLALLSESVDYETLAAFNPHLPQEPEEVERPEPPEKEWGRRWSRLSDKRKVEATKQYEANLTLRINYERALEAWRVSDAVRAAPGKLAETVKDLEQRGLLQYDSRTRRYDLHPVVRGVAAGGMKAEDTERYGQRVLDHFSSLAHNPYEEAKTIEELEPSLHVVRTLLKLGRYQEAGLRYRFDLARALPFNLEAYVELLSLLRPFFPSGWDGFPQGVDPETASYLSNEAAMALNQCGEEEMALAVYESKVQSDLRAENWVAVSAGVFNSSISYYGRNRLAKAIRAGTIDRDLAIIRNDEIDLFTSLLSLFYYHSVCGQWESMANTWKSLDPMGRDWPRSVYRQGIAEESLARAQFWQGTLQEYHLTAAASLAEKDNNRPTLRNLHWLRGAWRLEQEQWELAAASFQEAIRMARERRLSDEESEAGLALAKLHLGQLGGLDDARQEAERLAEQRHPEHLTLAMLWLAIGDRAQAEKHALAAYEWAWADGEPFVRRYELTKTTELLRQMNVPIPTLPNYDPDKDSPFPWEADVRALIERLRAEKEAAEQEAE